MKNLRFLIPTLMLLFAVCTTTTAQKTYNSAVGLRLGYPMSASFKTFISETSALEAYVGFRGWSDYSWVSVSGAYQFHKPIDGVDNLNWYFGAGASLFFWSFNTPLLDRSYNSTSVGAQGYVGLDYKFENAPVNVTIDWIPTIFFNGFGSGFGGGYGSLGVRYVLSE